MRGKYLRGNVFESCSREMRDDPKLLVQLQIRAGEDELWSLKFRNVNTASNRIDGIALLPIIPELLVLCTNLALKKPPSHTRFYQPESCTKSVDGVGKVFN